MGRLEREDFGTHEADDLLYQLVRGLNGTIITDKGCFTLGPLSSSEDVEAAKLNEIHPKLTSEDWQPTFPAFIRLGHAEFAVATNYGLPLLLLVRASWKDKK